MNEIKRTNMDHTMSYKMYAILNVCIGSKELVRKRRLLYHYCGKDLEHAAKKLLVCEFITSGSKAEGMDLAGSDEDLMLSPNILKVYTEFPNIVPRDRRMLLQTDRVDLSVHPGFVIIKMYSLNRTYLGILTPKKFKYIAFNDFVSRFPIFNFQEHGPCLSCNGHGYRVDIDWTVCLKSDEWPNIAEEWITRQRHYNWPSPELVQSILNDGCLFVPIGYEGVQADNKDWRISFSKAEKLLIFSFNHVQFLTYGLLKLFLKEIVDKNPIVEGILCSYFMKTVLFWTIEESSPDIWVPGKLLYCFWLCVERLLCYVNNRNCPNFFIRCNNMFERKITRDVGCKLSLVLLKLKEEGIRCFSRSATIQELFVQNNEIGPIYLEREIDVLHMDEICNKTLEFIFMYLQLQTEYRRNQLVLKLMSAATHNPDLQPIISKLKLQQACHLFHFKWGKRSNKHIALLSKLFMNFLLRGISADVSAGKLLLATWLYGQKKYQECLDVVACAMKHLKGALYYNKWSTVCLKSNKEVERMSCGLNISCSNKAKLFLVTDVVIPLNSDLALPEFKAIRNILGTALAMRLPLTFPVNLFTHFLTSLCYRKLGNSHQMQLSLHRMKMEEPLLPNDPFFATFHKLYYLFLMSSFVH